MKWPKAAGGSAELGSQAFNPQTILAELKQAGLRITRGRREVLEVLFEAGGPLSLEDIHERARARGARIDFATVFRTMAMLEARGLVHKVHLGRPRAYFELSDPSRHYDHLVCTQCGKVVLLEEPCPLSEFEKALARRHGFRNVHHSLEFFGVCPEC